MTDRENKLIEKACDWLNRNDSYATPTNVKVNELRKFLEDSMQDSSKSPCMYNRTLEERKRGCRFCSAACKGRIKESESKVKPIIIKQEEE